MLSKDQDKNIVICPSILSADFANLKEDLESVETSDWLHCDVMDGHYVPNMSFGPLIVDALRPHFDMPLDVHLMISNPDEYLENYAKAGADSLTVHQEVLVHGHRTIQKIIDLGCSAGMAINPGTPVETLREYLPYLDLILIMTVNPGFGGQAYIDTMDDKISRTRKMIEDSGRDIFLQVDGGISRDNIRRVAASGADSFVAGSAIFSKADRKKEISLMRDLGEEGFASR